MKYKFLGNTGLQVSELCLGTMTFGGKSFWEAIGKQGQEEVNHLISAALDQGINFIDTANVYSMGESENLLGNAIKQLGLNRDNLVIATKVRGRMGEGRNEVGLSRYHIMNQIDASLKRLQLDHIDLYQVHGFDAFTPLEETMSALNDVVKMGKVRYVGCCNLAAWQVMKANGIAEKYGWPKFVSTQNFYAISSRDIERELVPLVADQRMGVLPWSPLAGGLLSGKFRKNAQNPENSRRSTFDFPLVDKDKALDLVEEMDKIAVVHHVSVAQIALAWMLTKPFVTSIIIGAKTIDQLHDNLKSVDISLDEKELEHLNKVSELSKEYPGWMIEWQSNDRLESSNRHRDERQNS